VEGCRRMFGVICRHQSEGFRPMAVFWCSRDYTYNAHFTPTYPYLPLPTPTYPCPYPYLLFYFYLVPLPTILHTRLPLTRRARWTSLASLAYEAC
jgi:hypothetical protein